jgi:hypothetical protein
MVHKVDQNTKRRRRRKGIHVYGLILQNLCIIIISIMKHLTTRVKSMKAKPKTYQLSEFSIKLTNYSMAKKLIIQDYVVHEASLLPVYGL